MCGEGKEKWLWERLGGGRVGYKDFLLFALFEEVKIGSHGPIFN